MIQLSDATLIITIGKKISCGAIILYCLNLPPDLRYKPENVFIIGLTPSPYFPDVTTISHLLDPVVNALAKYGIAPGQLIPTYNHPNGAWIQARVAPLIADLEASRKASGFLSHAATMFCSFCLCKQEDLKMLTLAPLRNSVQVRSQVDAWLKTETKSGRAAMEKETGVRWTSLYRLPYWDPVRHVVLGYMHNWLEGILQNHLRTLWGLGRAEGEQKRVKEIEDDEQWTDTDVSDSANELDDLLSEAAEYDTEAAEAQQNTSQPSYNHSESSFSSHHPTLGSSTPSSSSTPTVSELEINSYLADAGDNNDDMDLDYQPVDTSAFSFTDLEIGSIQSCIRNVTLPTWIQRPPVNLGEASHGKLKAHEYLLLFTCIFPLVIPEFWHHPDTPLDDSYQHLECFYHLVSATNILSSFKTSNSKADTYTQHYTAYYAAIQTLFPYHNPKPNHHYAMHNGDLMKYWGPLPVISESFGERMNGMLQGIKTNRRFSMYI